MSNYDDVHVPDLPNIFVTENMVYCIMYIAKLRPLEHVGWARVVVPVSAVLGMLSSTSS